jgi:AcrR family transcriptional regulator
MGSLQRDTIDIQISMVFNAHMTTRLRRPEMVARNREAVLAAARRVFLERGYAGATLEMIAEEAGFSKGVMYSQFDSKADLFLTLLHRRIDERAQEQDRIVNEHVGADGLRALIERFSQDAAAQSAWLRATIEFRALASRDPELNQRYAAAHARTVERFASALALLCMKAKVGPAVSERLMAEFILALSSGTVLEWAANPAALPIDDVVQLVARALGFMDVEPTIPVATDSEAALDRSKRDSRSV